MCDDYPYSELDVYVAGLERGRRFVQNRATSIDADFLVSEELASRRLTIYDLTRQGLLMLGLRAEFVPRDVFEAGVRRAIDETIARVEAT